MAQGAELGDISRDHLRRAAATLSLLAPKRDTDEIDDVLSRLREWSQKNLLRSRFAELLVESLLRDDGAEAVSLRPDPVAEHLVLEVFGKNPDLLDRVLPQDPAQVPGLDDPDAEDSVVTRALEMGQQVAQCLRNPDTCRFPRLGACAPSRDPRVAGTTFPVAGSA